VESRFDSFMQQTIAKERKIRGHTDSPDEKWHNSKHTNPHKWHSSPITRSSFRSQEE